MQELFSSVKLPLMEFQVIHQDSTKSFSVWLFFCISVLLVACGQADEKEFPVDASSIALPGTIESALILIEPSPTKSITLQPQPSLEAQIEATNGPIQPSPMPAVVSSVEIKAETATPSLQPSPSPSPLPIADPYLGLSIEELARRDYGGGELDIVDTLVENEHFKRYLVTYPSDGLTIYGYMNVPNEGNKFPIVIMLHGYIAPSEYQTVTYTERYANALAEAGYFVFHPNLRNYPPSDSGDDPFRIGFAVDVLNLIAIIREQSQDQSGFLRRADADDINLWGHSMGGGIALRTITVNNAPYIRSAVLYAAMSGDEKLNYERIREWSNGSSGDFELDAPAHTMETISPIYHLDRIQAPISIHHSQADEVVPPIWSDDLCRRLFALEHPAECFSYSDLPHTFLGYGDTIFIQRVIDFFNRH